MIRMGNTFIIEVIVNHTFSLLLGGSIFTIIHKKFPFYWFLYKAIAKLIFCVVCVLGIIILFCKRLDFHSICRNDKSIQNIFRDDESSIKHDKHMIKTAGKIMYKYQNL
jgi:hypothetical protein